jgi:hypothetical protein
MTLIWNLLGLAALGLLVWMALRGGADDPGDGRS